MKILAIQGDNRYLLVSDNVDDLKSDTRGKVLDLEQNKLFQWSNIHSTLARGYWEEFEGDQEILDDLLDQVEEV